MLFRSAARVNTASLISGRFRHKFVNTRSALVRQPRTNASNSVVNLTVLQALAWHNVRYVR